MRILITGGAGFIGTHLLTELLNDGHEITIIDSLSKQVHGDNPVIGFSDDVIFLKEDIRNVSYKPEMIDGFDAIYHLVSETGTGQSMYEIGRYCDINCMGTASLLQAITSAKNKPKHLILASSRSVYGEGSYRQLMGSKFGPAMMVKPRSIENLKSGFWEPTDVNGLPMLPAATSEDFPFQPLSLYAATKAAQELLLQSVLPPLGIRTTILRLQNVYGEGQSLRNPYTGIISIFYNRIRQNLPIAIYEDGLETRDFIHVSDVVTAMKRSLDLSHNGTEVINIGSGVQTSVSSLAEKLISLSGYPAESSVTGQYRVGDIRHCFADITKAISLLKFKNILPLEEGLTNFINWAEKEPAHEDLSVLAEHELLSKGLSG